MDELLSSFACSISGKFLRKLPVDIAMATALASARPRPLPPWMEFRHLSACKNHRQLQMLAQVKYVERALFLSLSLAMCHAHYRSAKPARGRTSHRYRSSGTDGTEGCSDNSNNEHIKWRNVFLGCNCRVTLQVPSVVSLYVCVCV